MVRLKVQEAQAKAKVEGYFNSSMVRLKELLSNIRYPTILPFQFLYGAIKSPFTCFHVYNFIYFNSSMVRLKERGAEWIPCTDEISIPLWCD